ncbi:hypothetical protein CsatB_027717 [Cannabis sativa]
MEQRHRFKNRGDRRRRLVRKTRSMTAILEIDTMEFSNSEEEKIDEDAVKNDDGTILSQRSNETLGMAWRNEEDRGDYEMRYIILDDDEDEHYG